MGLNRYLEMRIDEIEECVVLFEDIKYKIKLKVHGHFADLIEKAVEWDFNKRPSIDYFVDKLTELYEEEKTKYWDYK